MVDPCWSSFPPWKLKPPMRLHIGQWGKQAKRKDSWGSLTFRTFKTSLKSGRSPVFFLGGGYWVKIGRNWGIKGPALGWTTFDPDFSFRIKPLDSSPTRSLVFLCPNLADLRPNRSKPEKCSSDNDLLLASFLGTWAGWQFFFLLQDFLQRGPCMATLLPRCPWSSAAQLVKHGQTIQFHVYIWHKKNLLLIYMQMPYACNSKWLHTLKYAMKWPWNSNRACSFSLFQSCRLALMDWSFPNCRHFIAVTKMAKPCLVPSPISSL